MPWDGTELHVAELHDDPDGRAHHLPRPVGGRGRQPRRSRSPSRSGPTTATCSFVSDRTDWWNLYRLDAAQIEAAVAAGPGSPAPEPTTVAAHRGRDRRARTGSSTRAATPCCGDGRILVAYAQRRPRPPRRGAGRWRSASCRCARRSPRSRRCAPSATAPCSSGRRPRPKPWSPSIDVPTRPAPTARPRSTIGVLRPARDLGLDPGLVLRRPSRSRSPPPATASPTPSTTRRPTPTTRARRRGRRRWSC